MKRIVAHIEGKGIFSVAMTEDGEAPDEIALNDETFKLEGEAEQLEGVDDLFVGHDLEGSYKYS